MAATEEARLNLIISAQNRAAEVLGGLGKTLGTLQKAFFGLGSVLAGGWVFKDIMNTTVQAGMEVDKLSRDLGITAEAASELRMAADDMGLSMEGLTSGITIFAGKLMDVGKSGSDPFAALGVSITDSNGNLRDTMDILGQVADQFATMPDSLAKLGVVRDLFGRGGEQWLRLLNQGSEGIKKLGEDAEKMGLMFNAGRLAQIRDYQLAVNDVGDAVEGLKVTLGTALLPALANLARGFIDLAQQAIPWIRRGLDLLAIPARMVWSIFVSVANVVRNLISGFLSAGQATNLFSSSSKTLGTAWQWLASLGKGIIEVLHRLEPLASTIGNLLAGAAIVIKDEWAAAGHIMGGVLSAVRELSQGDVPGALQALGKGFKDAGVDLKDMADETEKLGPGLQLVSVTLGTIGTIKLGETVIGWLGRIGKWLLTLTGGAAGAGLLGLLGMGVSDAVTALVGGAGLSAALAEVGAAFAIAFESNPVGWIITIGAAIIGFGILIYSQWDHIKAWTMSAWGAIKEFLGGAVQGIKTFFGETVPGWKDAFVNWTTETLAHVGQWFADLPANLGEKVGFVAGWLSVKVPEWKTHFITWTTETLSHIAQWFVDLPGNLAAKVGEFAAWLGKIIPEKLIAFTDWLADVSKSIGQWFTDLPTEMGEWIMNIIEKLKGIGGQIGSAILGGIKSALGWLGETIMNGIEAVKNLGKSVGKAFADGAKEGQAAASGSGTKVASEDIVPHAAGGIFTRPTLIGRHLFGEAGAEILAPLTPGNLARFGGTGLGGPQSVIINLTVQGSVLTERDLVDAVKRGIMQDVRLQKQLAW